MQEDRSSTGARLSAETSTSAGLDDVWRWLVECKGNPVSFDADDLPALGLETRLRLALPMTARRAVLCALWLLEDVGAGSCLLAGQLRFVAHPGGSEIRLSFNGRTAAPIRSGLLGRQADHVASQLLAVIAESIQRPPALDCAAI